MQTNYQVSTRHLVAAEISLADGMRHRLVSRGEVRSVRVQRCEGCGCTDGRACTFGCVWVIPGRLCSNCTAPFPGLAS